MRYLVKTRGPNLHACCTFLAQGAVIWAIAMKVGLFHQAHDVFLIPKAIFSDLTQLSMGVLGWGRLAVGDDRRASIAQVRFGLVKRGGQYFLSAVWAVG